jgi:hypothetical protein
MSVTVVRTVGLRGNRPEKVCSGSTLEIGWRPEARSECSKTGRIEKGRREESIWDERAHDPTTDISR